MSERLMVSHARTGTTRGQVGKVLVVAGKGPRNALVDFGGRLVVLPFRCLRRTEARDEA